MPTCQSCNRTVKNGEEIKHWICEDCKVQEAESKKEPVNDTRTH